jgi:hydroxyacylglutathione hydrolase
MTPKALHITPILALKDNYIWALCDVASKKVWVVDPGETAPVISFLRTTQTELAGILITHHHADHTGGIAGLLKQLGEAPVVGSIESPIQAINHRIQSGEHISCFGFALEAIAIPGHTLDHTAYYAANTPAGPIVFTGDTLFSAGCGRIFEGTPEMMYRSLKRLYELPDHTALYCGHEYTLANLRFAEHVEPNNAAITQRKNSIHGCSLPVTLGEEKTWNPFLRCKESSVQYAASRWAGQPLMDETAVFAALRQWKNQF